MTAKKINIESYGSQKLRKFLKQISTKTICIPRKKLFISGNRKKTLDCGGRGQGKKSGQMGLGFQFRKPSCSWEIIERM